MDAVGVGDGAPVAVEGPRSLASGVTAAGAARAAVLAVAGAGAVVLLAIAAAGGGGRTSWLLGASLMLAADAAAGVASAVAARACRGAERLAFALLAALCALWASTRVLWLIDLAGGGTLRPTPLLQGIWVGAALMATSVPVLLYVHHRSTPSWDGLMDGAATAAAVGALLWMTAISVDRWDSPSTHVTATVTLSLGAGATVALAGMFAWRRSSLGGWLEWMVGGAVLLILDVALSITAAPAADHADLRTAAMASGALASACLAAAALTRARGDGGGVRRVARGRSLVARGLPTAAVLVAVGALAWGHGAAGALVVAAAVILGLRTVRSYRTVQSLLDERSTWALTDALTGLRNRRAFESDVRDAVARADRAGESATLLMLDLDGFKAVNDARGHGAGDALLVAVAEATLATVRTGEQVYRLGGDEFVVLLAHDRPEAPRVAAERMRDAIVAAAARHGSPAVTVSIGIAGIHPGGGAEAALHAADAALYRAKAAGRNRIAQAARAGDGAPGPGAPG